MMPGEFRGLDPNLSALQRGSNQSALDMTSRFGPGLSALQEAIMQGNNQGLAGQASIAKRQAALSGQQSGMQEQQQGQQLGAQAYGGAQARKLTLDNANSQLFAHQQSINKMYRPGQSDQSMVSTAMAQGLMQIIPTILGYAIGGSAGGAIGTGIGSTYGNSQAMQSA